MWDKRDAYEPSTGAEYAAIGLVLIAGAVARGRQLARLRGSSADDRD